MSKLEDAAMEVFEMAMVGYFPPWPPKFTTSPAPDLTAKTWLSTSDPLPTLAKDASWDTKDRYIEWVRANFTAGMLAKLYKLSYDADGLRRDKCDEIIKKG